MKIKLIFLLFLASLSSFAQYTLIPDINFEKKLINLGIDSGGIDGKVLKANVSSLTNLDVSFHFESSSSITDLTGIQDFIALTTLRCYNNQLTSLDVSKNVSLTYLDCSRIPLMSLDVSKNTALTYLNCQFNQLTALDVSKNTALENLNCDYNKLTSLDVSKNTALKSLVCSYNELTALDVSQNSFLVLLQCTSNQLMTLDVSKNSFLRYLQCTSNQLTTLDVSKNTVLRELYCDSNKLTSLNIKNGNNIYLLNTKFSSNPNLSCIQVDDVAYANANWAVAKDATAGYTADCSLQYTFIPDVKFENKLIALGVDTDGANGRVLTANIASLTSLNVSNSFITNLNGIQDFVALKTLYCNSNQLKTIDVTKNVSLTYLYCNSNQLKTIDVSKNTALTYLNCQFNQLTALDVSKNTALENLKCDYNKLTSLDVSKNTALKSLVCSYNELMALDVSNNTALIFLECPYNQLRTLYVSSKNSSLSTLNCSSNQLMSLDLSKNTALANINCSSNQLLSLNIKNGNNGRLSSKNFTNNPNLRCIEVDNAYGFNNSLYWTEDKDNTAFYSENCPVPQLTFIPDSKFEDKLIALGIDTDGKNGFVFTSSVNTITFLNVSSSGIADLTGIQDFVALKSLYCNSNQLTSLDVSKNTALINFVCNSNQLTSLDISKNTNLIEFTCYSNQLTSLDVSKNITLRYLNCSFNQLTSLDVSKNTTLGALNCYSNQLTVLNLKNGNNSSLIRSAFFNNPNLSCIQVDDVAYSNANWSTLKDATASYSTNCPATTVVISNEFEDKLIALGIDTDGKNGSVLLASITNVKSIDVSNSGITDLSGIEYFTDLETLICSGNSLTTINVSYNTALKYLDCSNNPLTTMDVSKNILLVELYCDGAVTIINKMNNAKTSVATPLTVLNLSNNLFLTKLSCSNNQLINLDLSKNTLLTDVNCSNNNLQNLNVNNGNNTNMLNVNFKNNSSLSCIQVDDTIYSNTNWAGAKDATAIYSKTACTLGLEDVVFDKISIYPNPVKGQLHIDNIVLEKVTVYDALGKLIKTTKFTNASNSNTLDLGGLTKGVYFIYPQSNGTNTARKIIVE